MLCSLDESLGAGDVSRAWLVWSGAAEAALADACQFCVVDPFLVGVLVLGAVVKCFCFGLSGLVVTRFGKHVVMLLTQLMLLMFSMYRDSSVAPLLDMRRRLKAVMSVLDAMTRYGVSLSRSVELSGQWDRILAVGPWYPVTLDDLDAVQGLGIGDFHRVASGFHHRLGDFIHAVVVHRRDEAIQGWRNWVREDPLVHLYQVASP